MRRWRNKIEPSNDEKRGDVAQSESRTNEAGAMAGPQHQSSPAAASLEFAQVCLAPGDVIVVPAGWWHTVEGRGDVSMAVNWYFECAGEGGGGAAK